jgi:hypothetical protein
METLVLHIPTDKKAFFLSLLQELSFVEVEETSTMYETAVLASEKSIAEGKVLTASALKTEMETWRSK